MANKKSKSSKSFKSKKKAVRKSVKNKVSKKQAVKKTSVKKMQGKVADKPKTEKKYVFKRRPLPASFMIVGLFGLIVSAVYTVSARIPVTWGFMFIVFFLIMFIAALVSLEPNKGDM